MAVYNEQLDEDGQVDFKGKAKTFIRTYGFLASILPYTNAAMGEAVDLPELPDPEAARPRRKKTCRKGILEAIDMDSYRVEKKAAMQNPASRPGRRNRTGSDQLAAVRRPEPELDRLSNILKTFNDQFGNIAWADGDRVRQLITEEIPEKVAADTAYQNATTELRQAERPHRTRQGARLAS